MSVAACKRCNGPSSVTRDEWDRVLDTVRECYLNKGQTLPAIRQFMHEHHDFHAKERHYKTRLHQAEKAPKRLSRQQYRAMATVVGDEGSEIAHFIARRGHREVTITPQQIHKEMGRCRKKWQIADSPSSPPPLMSLSEAHHVLENSGIRLVPADHPIQSGWPIYPTPAEMIASPASTDTSVGAVTPSASWSSPAPREAPIAVYALDRDFSQLSVAGMGGALNSTSPAEYPNPHEYSIVYPAIDLKGCCMSSNMNTPFGYSFGNRGLPPPQAPPNPEKQRTIQWLSGYFQHSFALNKDSLHDPGTWKLAALNQLRTMLTVDPANKYIFPGLNEVVTVLGAYEKSTDLQDFLRESCTVLDGLSCGRSPLATPFRYALAACSEDIDANTDAMERYGAELAETHRYLIENKGEYGQHHPNVLVNSYYRAWHLLRSQKHSKVIEILQDRLNTTKRILSGGNIHALYGRNLMIVNCMAILGRAYAETHQHGLACDILEQALSHLDDTQLFWAYRLEIVHRLAQSQLESGHMIEAAAHLQEVVQGRLEIFGYSNAGLWHAIHTLCDLLRRTRREAEANAYLNHHELAYRRQQDRQWYKETGQQIPADLLNSPKFPPELLLGAAAVHQQRLARFGDST